MCPGPVNTDIMNSLERNQPDGVPLPSEMTEEESLFRKAYEIWLERGLDPIEVGRQVLDAIREEELYVITHDFNAYIEQRMKNILHVKNPELLELPPDLLEIIEEIMSE